MTWRLWLVALLVTALCVSALLTVTAALSEARPQAFATTPGVRCENAQAASLTYRLVNKTRERVTFRVSWEGRVRQPVVRPGEARRHTVTVEEDQRGTLRVSALGRLVLRERVSVWACRAPRAYLGEQRCRRGEPAQELFLDSRRAQLRSTYHWRLLRPKAPYTVEDRVRVAPGTRVRVWLRPLHRYAGLWVGVTGRDVFTYGRWDRDGMPRC